MNEDIKKEARELVEKFIQASVVDDDGELYNHPRPFTLAQQCALIDIQNTIDALEYCCAGFDYFTPLYSKIQHKIKQLESVKQAIEQL